MDNISIFDLYNRSRLRPGGQAACRSGRALNYAGAALTKADRRATGLSAVSAEDHLVAVLEEGTGFSGGEHYLPLAIGAQLHQAAIALRRRPRDRAGAEQIAGGEIAAAASVVRDQLGEGPVKVGRVAGRHPVRRQALGPQPLGQQQGFEHDVESSRLLVGVVPQIGQRPRILGRPRRLRDPERGERVGGDHPRRYGSAEILREKRPERV
jgi:hypothetical protein